jgi:hypothetical protein
LYSVYKYPARFSSKIFDIFFPKVGTKGLFFDPFAGSGSLAIACYLTCRDFVVWDLNPMIHVIVDASIKLIEGVNIKKAKELIETATHYGKPWLPDGAEMWWPQQFLDIIGRVWGYFRDNLAQFNSTKMVFEPLSDEFWSIFAVLSLYASRKISLTDDSIPKWYRSKFKRKKIEELLSTIRSSDDVKRLFMFYVERKLNDFARIQKYVTKPSCKPKIMEVSVVDAVTASNYPENIIGILTSPPYLQAQEYIRSFDWELKLLGVLHQVVTMLKRLEIPYRPPSDVEILSETYREVILTTDYRLRRIVESYFTNTLLVLEKSASNLLSGGVMGVFVGDATVRGRAIPIIKVFKEHLVQRLGLIIMNGEEIDDEIKKRRLFTKYRKNANPNGIKLEHLVFFKKP